ncbi:MAG TPA: multiheme c-type cytochrome [Longimicrobiales bacterium]|nr:multiheme c-type cytochrome [Longimicrobiales bacterium]
MTGVRKYGVLGAIAATLALSACVDEQIVYRDKPLFEDPPQNAVGFLGYSNVETKQTTCGNCHAGQQVAWKESAHADAWASLQASDHAADYCNDCHTISALGNVASGGTLVAYAATKDGRYEDVQCESCHGAGLPHVQDPSNFQPKASILAAEDATDGCGECHTDVHHPFVGEWEQSRHAQIDAHVAERIEANWAAESATTGCGSCHEGKIALKNKFGVTSEYAEQGSDGHTLVGITCVVCHDPHGNGNAAQLRKLANASDPMDNLCFQCHNRGARPSGGTSRNYPHAAQGPTIFGEIGWLPPGFTTDRIYGTHSSEANEGLCATCHLANFTVNDKATGAFTMSTTGHLFKALPCLDPVTGVPSGDESCTMTQRSFKGCVDSGCHGSEASARSATIAVESRLTNLSVELKRLVGLARAKVPADWNNDAVVTVVEGADFNANIFGLEGSGLHGDYSRGVHNPFLIEALLNSSITYIKQYYAIQ